MNLLSESNLDLGIVNAGLTILLTTFLVQTRVSEFTQSVAWLEFLKVEIITSPKDARVRAKSGRSTYDFLR